MPGILEYDKVLEGFGPYSTHNYRNMLLGRNLPPPVSQAIKDSKFASLTADQGNIVYVDNVGNENIRAVYELNKLEGKLLEENSAYERELLNLKNRYKPLNGYPTFEVIYTPYINAIAASLNLIGNGSASDVTRGEYPTNSNTDKFGLLSRGTNVGVKFPYNVIEGTAQFNLNSESVLGLSSAKHLQEAVGEKVAQVRFQNNPDVDNTGTITPSPNPDVDTDVAQYIDLLSGFAYLPNKSLPENAIGWQEFNSPPRNNNEGDLLNRISYDLGNYANPTLSTEERVDSLLSRTSDLQVGFILNALGMNPFVPSYTDRRLIGTDNEGTNSRYYIGSKRNTNRGSTTPTIFTSDDFNDSGGGDEQAASGNKITTVDEKFTWEKETPNNFNEKTILYETQNLASQDTDKVWIDQTDTFFKDRVKDRLISRGNAISKQEFIDADFNGNYCRVWTVNNHYSYLNAIRNTGLFTDSNGANFVKSEKASLSVLGDNGIVRTHPTKEDSETTFKKYMFSIENLAWADDLADLPLSEIGPGDLLSSNKGRIMWFPPYNLSFDENVSANWTATEFIGRGEPMYTYNSTTRSGQLRFQMIVDHPRVINGYRGKRSNAIERFFAGCLSPDDFLNILDKNAGVSRQTKTQIENKINGIKTQKKSNTGKKKQTYTILFAEGVTTLDDSEQKSPKLFNDSAAPFPILMSSIYDDIADAAINEQKIKITCTGFVGKQEKFESSKKADKTIGAVKAKLIGRSRAQIVFDSIEASFIQKDEKGSIKKFVNKSILSKGNSLSTTNPEKTNRRVEVTIENDSLDNPAVEHEPEHDLGNLTFYPEQAQLIDSMIINETNYFDFIDLFYPNYFANISEKIKYFQPGFHSTTPEGLNTRMSFLQQCMRQGPSINNDAKNDKVKPQNLSFGRPPVLILRIGDFFYSKVVCDSLNITYETGGNIQWDLNPSGIGVQPMVANVTMSINVIGGQSLQGPINRLQNAVSFNYYSNTEMYDFRSDTITIGEKGDRWVVKDGESLGNLKKDHLKDIEGGVDQLVNSLKGEGILNQQEIAKKAKELKDFQDNYGIFISIKGEESIFVTSTTSKKDDTPAEIKPSEMSGNTGSSAGKKLVNNLLAINMDAKYQSGDILAKNIYKEKVDLKSIDVTNGAAVNNKAAGVGIADLLEFKGFKTSDKVKKINDLKKKINIYIDEVDFYQGKVKDQNSTTTVEDLKKLKYYQRKLKNSIKKLERIKDSATVDIEVVAYYTEDKKGSLKRTTYTWNGAYLEDNNP